MLSQKMVRNLLAVALWVSVIGAARADVFNMTGGLTSLEFVPVGNPGNSGQLAYGGFTPESPPSRVCGEVDYTYSIGKFEVTSGQYCEFLNAVAKTDTYGLYNPYMDLTAYPSNKGCNIMRTGSSGNYTYSVALDWANRPVNYVSIIDAARFANWLTNGQPTGSQDNSTTEDGTYNLHYPTDSLRNPNALYAITSEDEWYKAAYYDPNKPGGAGYWKYPTKSDSVPSNIFSSTGVNNANYASTGLPNGSIGASYYRTMVGAFSNTISPYGTYDQAGNVREWNESYYLDINFGILTGISGSSFSTNSDYMNSSIRTFAKSNNENPDIGFRVTLVPEPSGVILLLTCAVTFILFFRRHGKG